MKKYLWFWILGIYINSSIAGGGYDAAEAYLKAGDFELAAKEYMSIIEAGGSSALSKDIRAMTGAFISFYMLQEYKKSFALCKRVLNIQSYNSPAIFYAGQNLGAMGKVEIAKKLYRYHKVLPKSDPYRPFIKSRYDFLIERELEKQVRKTIQLEGRIDPQKIPENNLAVIYIINDSHDQSYDPLSKGLTDFLIDDFSKIKNLTTVSRTHLQMLIDELNFTYTDLLDENLIPRLGRLLNSRWIVSGTFYIEYGEKIVFNIGLLNINQPNKIDYKEFNGQLNHIFKIEKEIFLYVINQIGIQVSQTELKQATRYKTKSLEAFEAYSNGLDIYDVGNYENAVILFSQANQFDPGFYKAWDMKTLIDAVIMIDQGKLAQNHFKIYSRKLKPAFKPMLSTLSLDRIRLQKVLINLDMGQFPGNDSRNHPSELDLSEIPLDLRLLDEPPPPPVN